MNSFIKNHLYVLIQSAWSAIQKKKSRTHLLFYINITNVSDKMFTYNKGPLHTTYILGL